MDKVFRKYFEKHPIAINTTISSDIKVVVPVYLEEEDLPILLNSLSTASKQSKAVVELVLVFNYSDDASQDVIDRQHQLLHRVQSEQSQWENDRFKITCLKAFGVAKKHAGVGNARKVGMDYAAFSFVKGNKPRGIIVSLDADCRVQENYFEAIIDAYSNSTINGCNIYFEHPMDGSISEENDAAIAEYELHLRYYVQALRYIGFPLAFHTVGSCFTVTADTYLKVGGMPRKQAGEDFYFLQKIIPSGKFIEISNTVVYPSSRPSDRVPFGTGPSINTLLGSDQEYQTYNLQAFLDLNEFLDIKDELYTLKPINIEEFTHKVGGRIRSYLLNSDFFKAIESLVDNCSTIEVFQKRFYEVFSAFRVVKYLNYTHEHFLDKMPVFDAALNLEELMTGEESDVFDTPELLDLYRHREKQG
ncbi:glycosyltransferase family 2 protein [Carboxylicivirga sp. M1479]|uniref:glycosyltransferase n=1 Tax=Carboxylicivirga sp. M1479 TaxID=2594476 RepID=UPI0011779CB7|nr:glycosyltransferase family 2 protein [Carboxylicivirga sp. M1479]TRX70861.1 glycosyltransferase [Carboxylicivirga sp. M1479]